MSNAEITKSFLKIAKSDLKASKLLFKKRLFPQSIYFFQQAVEKSNKALTIYGGYFTLSEARDVRHSQTRLVRSVLKKHAVEVNRALSVKDQIPSFLQVLRDYNFDFESYAKNLIQVDSSLAWINEETELRNLSGSRLQELLSVLTVATVDLGKLSKGELFLTFQDFLKTFIDRIKTTEIATAPSGAEEIGADFNSAEIAKIISVVFVNALDVGAAAATVHILGFIFDRLMSKVRYPELAGDTFIDPLKIFNGRLPLVKKMPEFYSHLARALRIFERTIGP